MSGGSNAGNFAQPLNATGFIQGVVPFTGPEGPGLLTHEYPTFRATG